MNGLKRYVVGFMFDPTFTKVVLIRKMRPAWQAGNLNGVGGHVEEGEAPHDAMPREYQEETGVETTGWCQFLTYGGGDLSIPGSIYYLYVYWNVGDVDAVKTITDETVEVVDVSSLIARDDIIVNLRWLVQMAKSFQHGERAPYWNIQEGVA